MFTLVKRLIREIDGQDLIEYSLLGAVISVSAIAVMKTLATAISVEFGKVSDGIQ